MELTPQHREILTPIGEWGAALAQFRGHGREFGELSAAHLVVFWPTGGERPATVYGSGTTPGRWYLTKAGADALGAEAFGADPANASARVVIDDAAP